MATVLEHSTYQPVNEVDSYSDSEEGNVEYTRKLPYPTSPYKDMLLDLRSQRAYRCSEALKNRLSSSYVTITLVNAVPFSASLAMLLISHHYVGSLERNASNRLVQMTSTYSKLPSFCHVLCYESSKTAALTYT